MMVKLLLSCGVVLMLVLATITPHPVISLLGVLVIAYLGYHLFYLHSLMHWIRQPRMNHVPHAIGWWEQVFSSLYQNYRRFLRQQAQLNATLERFQHVARALLDGVVILDRQHRIEWCNPLAEQLLGLDLEHDRHQPIHYIVRQNEFIQYLQGGDYTQALKLSIWREHNVVLRLHLVSLGNQQNLLICQDITQLEILEIMRRDFIANVSHELRTPLTVIHGFVEILQEQAKTTDVTRPLAMIQSQTDHMRRLVDDLLTLSRIEDDSYKPVHELILMQELGEKLLADAQTFSQGKHHIDSDIDATLNLHGVYAEIYSAFSNLVSNAIRYTPAGGKIHIRWQRQENTAVFTVQDNGIGIEAEHIPRLTERFYRVEQSRSRETGGTGLGLSIVKHILLRHNATLSIDSRYGEGSTFQAIFPISKVV